jgi:signal transduction histidine kinase
VKREESKVSEAELKRAVAEAVMLTEARVRTRFARDLHDGVQGLLAAAKLSMGDDASETKPYKIIEEAIQEIRLLASGSNNLTLEKNGLLKALEEQSLRLANVKVRHSGENCRYRDMYELAAYYSAMELITNAVKHSGASRIDVQLVQYSDSLSITVQDNGKGFDTESVKYGVGLRGISERLSPLGSELDIVSSPEGGGTCIRFDISIESFNSCR